MKEIKVINALDIGGKETPFSELTAERYKQVVEKIQDTVMNFAGYRRKTPDGGCDGQVRRGGRV